MTGALSTAPEALALGFTSGLACLASCGTVLLPWLAGARRGWKGTLALLGVFLGGRLGGYLVFGVVAGLAGRLLDLKGPTGLLLRGLSDLAVAALLALQAWRGVRAHCAAAQGGRLERRFGTWGLALLGLLTGLNLCGPFAAAALRAAQAGGPGAAAAFMTIFFAGTAVWMLPALLAGFVRREALVLVARLTLGILSIYYTCTGILLLVVRLRHG